MDKTKLKKLISEQLDFNTEQEREEYARKIEDISESELQIRLNYLIQGND